jgi:hypothetical protein
VYQFFGIASASQLQLLLQTTERHTKLGPHCRTTTTTTGVALVWMAVVVVGDARRAQQHNDVKMLMCVAREQE